VVINNEIGTYEFIRMKKETFLLNEILTLANVVRLLRERLSWMDEGCEVWFEGRIDIGSSNDPLMKMISPVCDEKEWTAYVDVVMESKIHGIKLVARIVSWNDVGNESSRLPTLLKAVDEQHVKCGVMLTHSSQENQVNTDAEEPPFIVSNETVLNMKPVYRSVGVGDPDADTGFILGVDHQSIATRFAIDVDPSFVEPEFMPKYETTFGNERADDSADDRSVPELSKRDKALL
jgi:hypothetical protein